MSPATSDIIDIPDAPGYGLSRDGRAWTKKRRSDAKDQSPRDEWRELTPSTSGSKKQYRKLVLRVNGKGVSFSLHKLVMQMFGPPQPSPRHEVRHWDGDGSHNHIDNLLWGTKSENCLDKRRHGTHNAGSNHPLAEFEEDDIREIRRRAARGETHQYIADLKGCARETVSQIVRFARWGHVPEESNAPKEGQEDEEAA